MQAFRYLHTTPIAPSGSANTRLAYIGQDLYLSGYQMGERIVSLVDSGLVGLFIATPGQLNIQPRLDAKLDAIKKSGKKIDAQTIATGRPSTRNSRRSSRSTWGIRI